MMLASPLIAAARHAVDRLVLFALLGQDPLHALYVFFIEPLDDARTASASCC